MTWGGYAEKWTVTSVAESELVPGYICVRAERLGDEAVMDFEPIEYTFKPGDILTYYYLEGMQPFDDCGMSINSSPALCIRFNAVDYQEMHKHKLGFRAIGAWPYPIGDKDNSSDDTNGRI